MPIMSGCGPSGPEKVLTVSTPLPLLARTKKAMLFPGTCQYPSQETSDCLNALPYAENAGGWGTRGVSAKLKPSAANGKQPKNNGKVMNNQFDELTKSLAQSVTRRAALKKFSVVMNNSLVTRKRNWLWC